MAVRDPEFRIQPLVSYVDGCGLKHRILNNTGRTIHGLSIWQADTGFCFARNGMFVDWETKESGRKHYYLVTSGLRRLRKEMD